MATARTIWHPAFTRLLKQRAPAWSLVRAEVPLVDAPLVVDDLIELRANVPHDLRDTGRTLRGLWPHIVRIALLEFKSVSREFRRGDLFRLLSYGWLYLSQGQPRVRDDAGTLLPRLALTELTLVLVVPSITESLRQEITEAGLTLVPSATGYTVVEGGALRLVVIDVTAAAEADDDDVLRWFGRQRVLRVDTRRWVMENMEGGEPTMTRPQDLEGYDDWLKKLVESLPPEERLAGLAPEQRLAGLAPEQRLAGLAPEQRLAGLAPEQRLAGLAPEQRLAGLAPEQRLAGLAPDDVILALPDEMLRRLPTPFIEALPASVRERIRARLRT